MEMLLYYEFRVNIFFVNIKQIEKNKNIVLKYLQIDEKKIQLNKIIMKHKL